VVTFELRDTLSLADHVNAASKRGRPVIFLDTPEAHVEALGLESAIGERMAPDLNGMAEWLGRRPVVDGGGTVDGIAGNGLHGEPGFLRTLVGKAEESSLALLKRLTAPRPAESWASATVRKLGSSEIGDMMRGIEWNERTDGLPTAIMLRFDPAATQGSLDVSIVAGFAERDFSAGRGALEAIHDKNFKLAQAKREALYRYALSVKSELEKMPDLRTKRFTVVVKQKKTRQLLSVLEPMPVLLYAPPHA
jgi:hypothetical protein